MKNTVNETVLEPSSNTHVLKTEGHITRTDISSEVVALRVKGDGVVTHGEHGTLKTESEFMVKYVQQELNPVTAAMQAAFD